MASPQCPTGQKGHRQVPSADWQDRGGHHHAASGHRENRGSITELLTVLNGSEALGQIDPDSIASSIHGITSSSMADRLVSAVNPI